jgi:deoxyribonuclease IV
MFLNVFLNVSTCKKMKIGPHVSLDETFYSTVTQMKDTPMGLLQIFMGPPVGYHIRRTTEDVLEKTGKFLTKYNKKLYVHAPYVINLASQEEKIVENGRKSIQKLLDTQGTIQDFSNSSKSCTGTVLHVGAKGPIAQVVDEINDLRYTPNSYLYLENAAQNKLGNTFNDLRLLREGIDSSNVGFCIDTCHTHSSGLANMKNPEQVIQLFEDLKDLRSSKYPMVIHLNDSKTSFKSKRDIHSMLGYGSIWNVEKPESFESLYTLLDICKDENYDVILETPSINIFEYEYEIMKDYI